MSHSCRHTLKYKNKYKGEKEKRLPGSAEKRIWPHLIKLFWTGNEKWIRTLANQLHKAQ